MSDFQYTLSLPVSAEKIYNAVAKVEGVRGWWTKFADIGNEEGSIAEFHFPKAGFFAKAETHYIPNRLVEWKVIDSMHPEKSGFLNLRDND